MSSPWLNIGALLILVYVLYKYYRPSIHIITLMNGYRIYLLYNKWDGPNYQGRVYKYLFEI